MTTEDKVAAARKANAKAAQATREAAKANAEATAAVAKDTAKKTSQAAKKGAEMTKEAAKKGAEATKEAAKKGAAKATELTGEAAERVKESADATRQKMRKPRRKVYIQCWGRECTEDDLIERALAQFAATEGAIPATKIALYIKPEEMAAYYVINGQYTGRVEF